MYKRALEWFLVVEDLSEGTEQIQLPPRASIITNVWLDDASSSPTMELSDIKQKIDGEGNEI